MKSQNAFLEPINHLASQSTKFVEERPTGTTASRVIYAEFSVSPKLPTLSGSMDIDDLVAELEKNAENAKAIAQGRQWVANSFYADRISVASLRLQKGWSQAELARRANTSQPYIARLELGRVDPQISTAKKLARALGVRLTTVVEAISPEDMQ